MHDYGKVSIITPTYNCAEYIGETIEGVLSQTYQDWELLITDDLSTDDTVKIIQSYAEKDERIKLLAMDVNQGAGFARNKSIERATGRFIAFCDGDDVWMPNKLEKQLEFMHENDAPLCHSSYLKFDENSKVFGIVVCHKQETFKTMKYDDCMGFLTVIYDTEKLPKQLMPLMRKRQDWAYKLILMRDGAVSYGMIEPLAYYRIGQASLSKNKVGLVKYNVNVYKETLGYSTLRAYLTFAFGFMPKHIMKLIRLKITNANL